MIESLNLEKSISREADKDIRLMKSDTLKNIEKSLKKYKEEYKYTPLLRKTENKIQLEDSNLGQEYDLEKIKSSMPKNDDYKIIVIDGLYQEELFGTAGFAGMSSLIYHLYPPTVVSEIKRGKDVTPKIAIDKNMKAMSFQGFSLPKGEEFLDSRKILFTNNDLKIGLAAPETFSKEYFFRNSDADEMFFIHEGSGTLKTMYGDIPFKYGDYLIIPRGTTYQIDFDSTENRILFIESASAIESPKRYRNNYGQFLEHSPFCERDFRLPLNLKTYDEQGEFKIISKKQDILWEYTYSNHHFTSIKIIR